ISGQGRDRARPPLCLARQEAPMPARERRRQGHLEVVPCDREALWAKGSTGAAPMPSGPADSPEITKIRQSSSSCKAKVGGWTETRPVSLGLLPSGPDPVGEWCVHRQPPKPYLDHTRDFRNSP